MERVKLNGKEYDAKIETLGNSVRLTMTELLEEKPKKQDIREYCKEHLVWAAKDDSWSTGWYVFTERPKKKTCTWQGNWDDEIYKKRGNFTYPAVPWDKSLIAPDGSMPLWEKKNNAVFKKEIKLHPGMTVRLKTLDKIKSYLGEKSPCWPESMDEFAGAILKLKKDCGDGWWDTVEWCGYIGAWMVDCEVPSKTKCHLHRGDPIFVWDDGASDRIPATVRYFSRIDDDKLVRVLSQTEENKEDESEAFNHYRVYDASLVEVPRRKWPKE